MSTSRRQPSSAVGRQWGGIGRRLAPGLDDPHGLVSGLLGEGPHLAGGEITLADLAFGTALGVWKGALNKAMPEKFVAYRERLLARPTYQRALTRANG